LFKICQRIGEKFTAVVYSYRIELLRAEVCGWDKGSNRFFDIYPQQQFKIMTSMSEPELYVVLFCDGHISERLRPVCITAKGKGEIQGLCRSGSRVFRQTRAPERLIKSHHDDFKTSTRGRIYHP
jgi:hypothetical protein